MNIDIAALLEIVKKTDTIIFNSEYRNQVSVKGPADYVTLVDKLVQDYLYQSFRSLYPDFDFMGEEKDNSDLTFSNHTWIIDPIDGTANLIHDCRFSAVSVGLWNGQKQKMELGIIYQPFSKELFYAIDGKGAYLNGSSIHVSDCARLQEGIISVGTAPYHKEHAREIFNLSHEMFLNCSDIRRTGSAALDLAYIACGRLDGYCEKLLSAWDYAAGLVILQEAGGQLTDYEGNPLSGIRSTSICCNNGRIHKEMLEIIHHHC